MKELKLKLNVKEIFGPTIQGEGSLTGWPAVFIRMAGCNMWSGKMEERASSNCEYCDTDFAKGQLLEIDQIMHHVNNFTGGRKFLIVVTGGEPLLQPSNALIELCKRCQRLGHIVQLETNGTVSNLALESFDSVSCSPKLQFEDLKIDKDFVSCWKILYPHPFVKLLPFVTYIQQKSKEGFNPDCYIQPITSYHPETFRPDVTKSFINQKEAIKVVQSLGLPWKLSIQMHNLIGVK